MSKTSAKQRYIQFSSWLSTFKKSTANTTKNNHNVHLEWSIIRLKVGDKNRQYHYINKSEYTIGYDGK